MSWFYRRRATVASSPRVTHLNIGAAEGGEGRGLEERPNARLSLLSPTAKRSSQLCLLCPPPTVLLPPTGVSAHRSPPTVVTAHLPATRRPLLPSAHSADLQLIPGRPAVDDRFRLRSRQHLRRTAAPAVKRASRDAARLSAPPWAGPGVRVLLPELRQLGEGR